MEAIEFTLRKQQSFPENIIPKLYFLTFMQESLKIFNLKLFLAISLLDY